jgi:hypothetical protein
MNKLNKTITTLLPCLALITVTAPVRGQSAREISSKSMDVTEIENIEMNFTIHIRDSKGNDRVRKISTVTGKFDGVNKTLIKFTSPADVKGTTLLIYDYVSKDDDMWIFMPALKKTRRLVSSEKSKSFMGSEFTNADMSKPNMEDFNYELLGSADVDGKDCWKIESTGKTQDIRNNLGYNNQISYIDKSNYLCYKVEYYDLSGKLQRIRSLSDYRKLTGNKYFAYHSVMENIRTNRVSEMIIEKLQSGLQFSENKFLPNTLDK